MSQVSIERIQSGRYEKLENETGDVENEKKGENVPRHTCWLSRIWLVLSFYVGVVNTGEHAQEKIPFFPNVVQEGF